MLRYISSKRLVSSFTGSVIVAILMPKPGAALAALIAPFVLWMFIYIKDRRCVLNAFSSIEDNVLDVTKNEAEEYSDNDNDNSEVVEERAKTTDELLKEVFGEGTITYTKYTDTLESCKALLTRKDLTKEQVKQLETVLADLNAKLRILQEDSNNEDIDTSEVIKQLQKDVEDLNLYARRKQHGK